MKNTILTVGASLIASKAMAQDCGVLTPPQTEGPFYPIEDQNDKDNDLTQVRGKIKSASGEKVILKGELRDHTCLPVAGALVEIWQACESGRYNHPGDTNLAKLDENFQYWGRAITGKNGEFEFKTIRPGYYPATANWVRPAHIHMKVQLRGFEELTTQLYFSDDPHLKGDRIYQSLSAEEQQNVTIDFKKVDQGKFKQGNCSLKIKAFN